MRFALTNLLLVEEAEIKHITCTKQGILRELEFTDIEK